MNVSVVIPTFNAGADIVRLLESLRNQKPKPPDEIIAIDSGSTDGTCDKIRQAGGRVVEWNEPFNHGLTRDAGMAASNGEIIICTVQDARLSSDQWLARVYAHFDDSRVAGVSGRQIPPAGGPLELAIKAQLDEQNSPGVTKIQLSDHPRYAQYSPQERLELYRFDNVCSAIRRSVWEQIPFGACRYAEDYQWARKVFEAGHALVRDPFATVVHAHRRGFRYEFRRALLDAWMLDEAFEYRYSFRGRFNRLQALCSPGKMLNLPRPGLLARYRALRTYSAHGLGRLIYATYCKIGKPMGRGRSLLERLTRGI